MHCYISINPSSSSLEFVKALMVADINMTMMSKRINDKPPPSPAASAEAVLANGGGG